MKTIVGAALAAVAVLVAGHEAQAGVKVSVNIGGGHYAHGSYYGYGYCAPPVVTPAPVLCPPPVVYHHPVHYINPVPGPVVVYRSVPVVVYHSPYRHYRVVHRDAACGRASVVVYSR